MREDRARSGWISYALRLLLLLLTFVGTLFAQQQQGNIAGEIRLVDGTFPSERLRVTLEAHGMVVGDSYSDSEGSFSFIDLLPNVYTVVIEAERYQPVRLMVVINPSTAQTNIVRVILRPAFTERRNSVPNRPSGMNPDIVDVAELAKKFPAAVIKEFEEGMKAEQHGEMYAAVVHYQAAIQQAPDFYPAHNSLGIRNLQKGDYKGAEAEFRRVLELNANSAQAYINLGNVLYVTRRNEEAKQALEAGLRLAPSSAMGHYLNGSVLARLGDFKTAEEQLKTARELDPKMPQVPITLATLYLQTGREHEAAAMFQAFLKEFPKDPMAPKVRLALNKFVQAAPP